MILSSFAPVYQTDAHILILGSMPGEASLKAQQYYAHNRNQFWALLGDAVNQPFPSDYDERLQHLKKHKIALWDVLQHCRRESSLDSRIERKSEVANDVVALLQQLPALTFIAFNGQKAEQCFRRHCQSVLADAHYSLLSLPSSSPAYAAMRYEAKSEQWAKLAVALF